jgi:DNA topoisomerase-1
MQWPAHIKKLKIPPAWKDVKYSDSSDAAIQVVGKDVKGRAQYIYSQKFADSQSAKKFARIKELDKKFDAIHKQNEDRLSTGDESTKEHAQCAALVMALGIRPGSDTDTHAKVKAYGATTLEGRHIVEENNKVFLKFVGKKGVAINLPVEDQKLAAILKRRSVKAGADGRLFANVSGKSLLDYTHTLNGGKFKTKDMRTLVASKTASSQIAKLSAPKNEKEYKQRVKEVATYVSSKLGNTPVVALSSYIPPVLFASWRTSAGV